MSEPSRPIGSPAASVPPPRGGGILSVPDVVSFLLLAMGAVFAAQVALPPQPQEALEVALGFIPARLALQLELGAPIHEIVTPVIGHMFVHGNIEHLVFNGLFLLVFGSGTARRLGADWRGGLVPALLFLAFFLVCGAGALGFYLLFHLNSPTVLVGASGAIFGLMAASLLFVLRVPTPGRATRLAGVRSTPVVIASVVLVGMELLNGLGLGGPVYGNIAWEAHIGGFLTGLLLFPVFDRLARL